MPSSRTLLASLAVAASLAACGSTVPLAQQSAGGALSAEEGLGLAGDLDAGGGPSAGSSGPSSVAGGAGPRAGATGGPSATATSTAAPVSSAPGRVTEAGKPVEVGFAYSANAGAFLAAFGIEGDVLDGRIYVDALLKYVNKQGGLAGHPVKPVYYDVDLTRTDPYVVWMQEMCAKWTQDHKVLAAIVPANSDFSPVAKCLAKTGAIFGNTSAWVRSQQDYRTYPNWFESSMLTSERLVNAYVDVPQQLGWFGPKPVIGMLAYDYPQSAAMAKALSAKLVAQGFPAPIVETLHMGQSTAELSGTIAAAQSATLRFRASGVTHVMSVAYPGAVSFFAVYADSQGYRPKYALTSYEGLIAVEGLVPASQLEGAVAVGWLANADVASDQKEPANATAKLCYSIYTAAGIQGKDQPGGLQYCDFLLMLQRGAAGLPALSGPSLGGGIERLGAGYLAPGGFGTTFGPGHHDGVEKVRPVRFDTACACFRYVGPPQRVAS